MGSGGWHDGAQVLNIPDAYKDPRFNPEIDRQTGFVTRNILCMPILDSKNVRRRCAGPASPRQDVIGVVQMVNKAAGVFDAADEKTFAGFAIYCGLGIQAVRLYEATKRSEMRAKVCTWAAVDDSCGQVALEVMSYHARASEEEAARYSAEPPPTCAELQLDDFGLNTNAFDEDLSVRGCIRMFLEFGAGGDIFVSQHSTCAGFETEFQLPHETLCRWLLTVKKNYRKGGRLP